MRPLPVVPLPGSAAFVLGLTIVRGTPAPVVDARRLLGPTVASFSDDSSPPASRFIAIKLAQRTAVLAVDAVLGIRPLPAGMLASIPPLLRGAQAELVSVVGALDAELLLVLEAARLIPDSIWDAINVRLDVA